MKATKQFFHVIFFINYVIKYVEQRFQVVLFIMLYKVVKFNSVPWVKL